jgi:hypothetical protein
MALRSPGKGKFALCIFLALIFCCSIPVAMANTVKVFASTGLQLTLPVGVLSGTFKAVVGPLTVNTYSQIRFYGTIVSGSVVNVTIAATNQSGVPLGILDTFSLNSSNSSTAFTSREYDTPAQYIVVTFTSGTAASVNTAIFGQQP